MSANRYFTCARRVRVETLLGGPLSTVPSGADHIVMNTRGLIKLSVWAGSNLGFLGVVFNPFMGQSKLSLHPECAASWLIFVVLRRDPAVNCCSCASPLCFSSRRRHFLTPTPLDTFVQTWKTSTRKEAKTQFVRHFLPLMEKCVLTASRNPSTSVNKSPNLLRQMSSF